MQIVVVALAVVVLVLSVALKRQVDANRRLAREVAWYRENHLTHNGWLLGKGTFFIKSIDGGRNWFNVECRDGGLIVTGPVDPELIAQLDGIDALTAHARMNGPLTDLSQGSLELLQNAGFTVTRQEA